MTTKAIYKMKIEGKTQEDGKSFSVVSYIEIVFGAPSKDCRGFGICKTKRLSADQFEVQKNQQKSRRAVALLMLSEAEDLCLCFLKSSMTKDTITTFFKQDKFRVEETNTLNGMNEKEGSLQLKINAGLHAVYETEEYLQIKLRS